MKIIFIRHGETTGDIENRYGGDYDDHLTEKGIEQAEQLAEELEAKHLEVLITSPMQHRREVIDQLASPAAIHQSREDTEKVIGPAVVFVMKLQ